MQIKKTMDLIIQQISEDEYLINGKLIDVRKKQKIKDLVLLVYFTNGKSLEMAYKYLVSVYDARHSNNYERDVKKSNNMLANTYFLYYYLVHVDNDKANEFTSGNIDFDLFDGDFFYAVLRGIDPSHVLDWVDEVNQFIWLDTDKLINIIEI